jgi:hypothetical protein
MKKILLSLMLICAFAGVKAQGVVLNEVYGNPGGTNSEFVELYNSSAADSLNCYTLLVYFENEGGTNKGWYVIDFPNTSIIGSLPGFFVLAPSNSFTTQGGGGTANLNWNDATFRGGTTDGYLKKYVQNGGSNATATYTEEIPPASITNLLDGTLMGSQFYFTLLYKNGILINGFIGGGASGTLSSYNIPLGTLNITPVGFGCSGTFNAFANLNPVEFFNPSGGNDNGYARACDGKCGSWVKTAPQTNHTPGITNGSATTCVTASMNTTESISCGGTPRFVLFDITGLVAGGATEADDFPVLVTAYADLNNNFALDAGDAIINNVPKIQASVASSSDTIQIPGNQNLNVILVYRTKRGCFDKVVPILNTCSPLPVHFASFIAKRNNSSSVNLVWQTASELNNSGFEVQRNVNGNWETVAFIPTQASGGNSDQMLTYHFTDMNNAKGMSQYRIRQIDFDGKSEFSVVRAVRGEGVSIKTVIYPNPSFDGRVNVVFEDASGIRDIVLMDMSGRMVRNWTGVSNNNLLIDNLNPGMYRLKIIVRETGAQTVEKLVVNKR